MNSAGITSRRPVIPLSCFFHHTALLLLLGTSVALSQTLSSPDTTKKAAVDTAKAVDSLRVRFMPGVGNLKFPIDSSGDFHSSNLVWSDARWFGNLVWKLPGFVLRDLGEPAKPGQLNAWGTDWRGIAVLLDGRPMNDPITGTYNLSDIPMEYIEQMEAFDGSLSIGQLWNAPGAALNFVTRQYNTLKPITKVRFVQSPDNNLLTDGLFTQNVLRGMNFMFGFQRQVSDGRFNGARTGNFVATPQGAIVDNWNVRTRLRYNFSDRLNFVLTDFYTKDINGLNGGIDLTRTTNVFDNVSAFVNDPNALETVARRDVSLLGIGTLTDDSTMVTQFNAYYTHLERSFVNLGTEFNPLQISDFHFAEVRGVRIQQSFKSSFHSTTAGFQAEHSQYSSNGFFDSTLASQNVDHGRRSVYSVFVATSLYPVSSVDLGLTGRWDKYGEESAPSLGARVQFSPLEALRLFGEYGRSYRFPTYQESSWADSTFQRPFPIRREQHTLIRGGIELVVGEKSTLAITAFDRVVRDAIAFQPSVTPAGGPSLRILNLSEVHTQGIAGSLNLHHGPFAFDGTLLFTQAKELDTTKLLLPKLILNGELTYRNRFFNNALDAKLGLRTHFMSRQRGMTFNPRMTVYSENITTDLGQWTRLDAFAVLKIGRTYISLSYENLLNANYLITPVYPMPGRSFRIGVNWVFFD